MIRPTRVLPFIAALCAFAVPLLAQSPAQDPFAVTPPLANYALNSCGDLTVSDGVIDSQGFSSSVVGSSGDIISNGNIKVTGGTVNGNATAGPSKNVTTSGSGRITGTKSNETAVYNCTPVDMAALLASVQSSNNDASIPLTAHGESVLTGTSHTDFSLSGGDSVTLPAGTYYFTKFTVSGGSTITVGGPVRIFASGTVSISGGSFVNSNPYRLKFWTSATQFTLSGGSTLVGYVYAPSASATFSASRLIGSAFANTITVSGSAHITRNIDDVRPQVAITSPANNSVVSDPSHVVVTGTAADDSAFSLTVNGQSVPVDANGKWTTTLSLTGVASPVTITAVATDIAGNVAQASVSVTTIQPPVVTLVSPAPGSWVKTRLVTLSGSAGNAASVIVNGQNATIAGGTWTLSNFDLGADGAHPLTITGTNAGGSRTITPSINSDTVAPAITLKINDATVTDGQIYSSAANISATIVEANLGTTSVMLDDAAVTLPTATAAEKAHHITITATDLANNTSSVTRNFTVDLTPPAITILANGQPLTSGATFRTAPTITYSQDDLTPDTIAATLSTSTTSVSFPSGAPITSEGSYTIAVHATDKAGHSSDATRSFVFRSSAPAVQLLANGVPFQSGLASKSDVLFTLHVDDTTSTTAVMTIDGGTPSERVVNLNDSTYAQGATVSAEGNHTISVVVTNAANISSAPISGPFTIDRTPPSVSITESGQPLVDGTAYNRAINPVVTASDNLAASPKIVLTVDGTSYPLNTPIANESANHTIVATATDDAGNTASTATYHFIIDLNAPKVSILDAATGKPFVADALFNGPVPLLVSVIDITRPSLALTVGGAPVDAGSPVKQADGTWLFTPAPITGDGLRVLSAVATDQAGNRNDPVSAQFTIDSKGPSIAFTAPQDKTTVGSPAITVQGSSDDAVRVVVNGRDAVVDTAAKTFAISNVVLLEGSNQITAYGIDAAGNRGDATPLTITLDTTPPALTVTSPLSNACLDVTQVTVSGSVSDASTATVTINGTIQATVGSDKKWTAVVAAPAEGALPISVTAADALGHTTTVSVPVTIDHTAPTVAILEGGAPFTQTNVNRAVTLFVRAAEANPVTTEITLDGQPYANGSAIATERAHVLFAKVTDCAGHIATATASFTIDLTPPAISNLVPANAAVINIRPAITGNVSTDAVSVAIEGTNVSAVPANGSFTLATPPWVEGTNHFVLVATDAAGNSSRLDYAVTIKTTAPVVTILENGSPMPDGMLYNRAVTPVIVSSDPVYAKPTATLSDAPFTSGTSVSAEGTYVLKASAKDNAENVSAPVTRTFTIDLTRPNVTIVSPQNGASIAVDHVDVRATTTSTDVAGVTINGATAVLQNGAYVVTGLPLDVGPNTIVATAVDRAGNSGTATAEVTRGRDPLGVVITEPTAAVTNRHLIPVAGQVLTPQSGMTLTVNNASTPFDAQGLFRKADLALIEGDNAITATVAAPNIAPNSATVHILADFTPPVLRLTANAHDLSDGARFGTAPALAASATDNNPGVTTAVTLDGAKVDDLATVTLGNGGHAITAIATDVAGNQMRIDRTFVVGGTTQGSTDCTLSGITPATGTMVYGDKVKVSGNCGGAGGVLVNDAPAQLLDGTFAADVTLQPGANTIRIACAVNGQPSGASTEIIVYRYTTAEITITSPHDLDVVTTDKISVTGTVGDGIVSGNVNGVPFTPQNKSFSVNGVRVSEGFNVIAATGVSGTGRSATATVRVKRLMTAPQIGFSSPLPATQTGAATIDVSGAYTNGDSSTLTITAGGTSVTVVPKATTDTNGSFTAASVPLTPGGTTTITATIRNAAGVTATATVDVQNVAGAPAITIDAPLDNSYFPSTATSISVTGKVTPAIAAINVNGVNATADANGNYAVALPIEASTPALLPIVARATTADGKSASDSVRVTHFSAALSVRDTYPSPNAVSINPGVAVVVLFTNILDASTVQPAFHLSGAGATVNGRTFVDRDAVTFAPEVPLTPGVTYTMTIDATVKDAAGSSMAAPYSFSFSVAATAPPNAPTLTTTDKSGCINSDTIGGTATGGARVQLVLDGTTLVTTAGGDGSFSFAVNFSQPGFHVARVRELASDGTMSPEAIVTYQIDCSGPQVSNASLDRVAKTISITFSRAMNPATLVASPTGTILIQLDGGTPLTGSVSPSGNSATVSFTDDVTNATVLLTVRKSVQDTNGAPMAADYVQTFTPSATGGYISGAVYDASNGRPLQNVNIDVQVPASATGGRLAANATSRLKSIALSTPVITDTHGRYFTPLADSVYTLQASASGYTNAWRQVVVSPGVGVIPIDIRLTRRATAQTAGSGALSLTQTGQAGITTDTALAIPAGALTSGQTVSLTPLGAQSLPGLLPLGWSPAAAVEIAVGSSPALQQLNGSTLTFSLGANAAAAIAGAAQTLSLVEYASDRDEWRVVSAVVNVGSDGSVNAPISSSGYYALVYPDKATQLQTPPPAHAGAALAAVGSNPCTATPTDCTLTSTGFGFVPNPVTAAGRSVATLVVSGGTKFPSGTAVQAFIDEELDLPDGRVITDPPFATDLLVYRDFAGANGVAAFNLSPTSQAQTYTLRDGADHVRIVDYPGRIDRGALIGSSGGRVPGDDSVTIDVPAGATDLPLHASVVSIPADQLQTISVAGFHVVGGFTFSMTWADSQVVTTPVLTKAARATFSVPSSASQVIVAEVLPVTPYGQLYRLAARTTALQTVAAPGTRVVTTAAETTLPVDGIIRDGRYVILSADQPVAFAFGHVVFGNGPTAVPQAKVSSGIGNPLTSLLGVADLTRNNGNFALPVAAKPAAPFGVQPSSLSTGDGAPLVPGDSPDADALRDLGAVMLNGVPPQLTAHTPTGEVSPNALQVTATFNAPLDPATVNDAALVVNNLTDGTVVAGHVALNVGNTVTFTPSATLPAGATFGATVAGSIKGTNGTRFGQPYNWHFSTIAIPIGGPYNVDPTKIKITIPDANGVSTISGAANALPPNVNAVAVRRGVAFIHQYQTTVVRDQAFSFPIGGSDPGDRVSIDDLIDLHVVDGSTGGVIAIIPLTPFVTADGTGFVARPDQTTTFTNGGLTVTVPAGAFDKPTVVAITKGQNSDFAAVPSFSNDLAYAAGINVTFDGFAKQRLEVQITPDTPGSTSTSYFVGLLGQSSLGPRVEIVDLLTFDGTKYTTTPSTSSGSTSKLRLTTKEVLTGPAARNFLLGIDRPGNYAAVSFLQAPAWVITTALQGLDLFPSTYPSIFTSARYMAERGRVLVPARAGLPFDIIAVDAQSGVTVATTHYTAVAANDPGAAAVVPSPVDAKIGPYPSFGTPARVEVVDLTHDDLHDTSHSGIKVDYSSGTVTLSSDPSLPLPTNTHVEAIDLATTQIYVTDDFKNTGLPPFSASLYDRIIIAVGAKDIDPASAIAISFNRPIDPANISSKFKFKVADIPVPGATVTFTDISSTTTVTTDNGDRRVLITLPSALQRGKLYRVVVSKTLAEPPTGVPGVAALKIAELRSAPGGLSQDLNFDFTTRAPAGEVAKFTIPAGTVRDLAMNGNLLFVSALEAGVYAYDASDPVGMATATPIARMNVPGAPGQVPSGEDWGLATDDHDRVWATGMTSTFGVVRSYRAEDVVNNASAVAPPPVINEKATSIVSWRVGVDAGLPLSTDAITISDRPEAIPRKMRIVVQDGPPASLSSLADLIAGYSGSGAQAIGGDFFKTTLQIHGPNGSASAGYPYMLQRVTIINVTRTFRWSLDVGRNHTQPITVIGQADDHFEVRRNYTTYGVVSLFGYGVGIFDLNAVDSNRVTSSDPNYDPTYARVTERVLISRAEVNPPCDPNSLSAAPPCDAESLANSGQHCPIHDLTFSPEAAIAATPETSGAAAQPAQLVVYGLEQNHGIVELRVTPPQPDPANASNTLPAKCSRANSLVFMERVLHAGSFQWFGHPRLNTLRGLFNTAAGRDPTPRFATISTYTTPAGTMYGLISAYEYGVLVVKLDPSGGLTDDSLVDVVWVPTGATSVRVLNGQNVASVVDGKGRVLLIDITQLDQSSKVPAHAPCTSFGCTWALYPAASGAIQAAPAVPDEIGADDPRIIWKQKIDPADPDPPLPYGTLPPLVDPDSGFIYTGNTNQNKVRVTSAIDPHVSIQVNTGSSDGMLKDASEIVPLGVAPKPGALGAGANASLAVFRLSVSLPGSISNSITGPGHDFRVAVESESVPGAPVAQSPAGFPRANLRTADSTGKIDPRPATSFKMQRLAPDPTDVDAKKLRYQRGYNRWASPWIIAIADLRASRAYQWNGVNPADAGCVACSAPPSIASLAEPQAYEMLASGHFIAARPEVCPQGSSSGCVQGSSIFGDPTVGYGYLGAANRLVTRVPTYGADTVRPKGVAIAGQNPPLAGGMLQESVYVHSGEVAAHAIDLVVGGEARMGFTVDRSYLSRTIGGTPFGLGWSSSIFVRLRRLPNGDVELRDARGETWLFTRPPSGDYTAPAGLFARLHSNVDGGWWLRDQQSNYTYFDALGRLAARSDAFANPTTAASGAPEGNVVRYLYDGHGNLANIVDAAGRPTTLSYWQPGDTTTGAYPNYVHEVKDWRGRLVDYFYDAKGRLTKVILPKMARAAGVPATYEFITDSTRPRMIYAYDDSTTPLPDPAPITPTQAYDDHIEFAGNLLTITDPDQAASATPTPRVTFQYWNHTTDTLTRDKINQQVWGTGEGVSVEYPSTSRTVVTDALLQKATYDFAPQSDNCNHVTRVQLTALPIYDFDSDPLPPTADPAAASLPKPVITSFGYDTQGELKTVTYPNGRIDNYTNTPLSSPATPGTILTSVTEQGGTQLDTQIAYDTKPSALARPYGVSRGYVSASGTPQREAQSAHRERLKTVSSDDDGGTVVGYETIHDQQGRVTIRRVIDAVPDETNIDTPGANVISSQVYTYESDSNTDPYKRGRLSKESDSASGGAIDVTHTYVAGNNGGEQETIVDNKRSVTTVIDRDAAGRTIHRKVTGSGGTAADESIGYDVAGRVAYVSRKQNGDDVITVTSYDVMGRPTTVTMQNGAKVMGNDAAVVTETKYELSSKRITQFDPHVAGATDEPRTVLTLDGLGRTIHTVRQGAGGGQTVESSVGYNLLGRVSFTTDSRSAVEHKFDTQGREIESVDESGLHTKSTWTAWGEIDSVEVLDPSANRVGYSKNKYTSKGRLRGTGDEIVPGGDARWTWHAWTPGNQSAGTLIGGAPNLNTNPAGTLRGTVGSFDLAGRPTKVEMGECGIAGIFVADGVYSQTRYEDYAGMLPKTTVSNEPRAGKETVTKVDYDPLGRATSSILGSYSATAEYDEAGNVITSTPAGMADETMDYDGRGLLLTDHLQGGKKIDYQYDALGNVRVRTDEKLKPTTYDVDPLGRVNTAVYPDTSGTTTEATEYEDKTGLVKAVRNRAGEWRSFFYDAHNNLIEVHNANPATAGNAATMIEKRTYDAARRLIRIANPDAAIEFDNFDLLGRPQVTRSIRYANHGALGGSPVQVDVYTQGHVWNAFGDRTRWRMPYAGNGLPTPETAVNWNTWIDEKHDAAGNVTAMALASDATSATGAPFVTSTGRSPGRLFNRTRTTTLSAPLQTVYRYGDTGAGSSVFAPPTGFDTTAPSDSTALRLGAETLLGASGIQNVFIGRDTNTARIHQVQDAIFGRHLSQFEYDQRGRLKNSWLAAAPQALSAGAPATLDVVNEAGFREERQSPLRLSSTQHGSLGVDRSLTIEAAPWTAPDTAPHFFDTRSLKLDGSVVKTLTYGFTGGRRTTDGTWTTEYDAFSRVTSMTNATLGRRIEYLYDPFGRMIGRTAKRASGTTWAIETDAARLTADGLPADTTFVWDPVTDRLVSIFTAGTATGLPPIRQYVHGDQGYDDPIRVNIDPSSRDGGSIPANFPTTYLPLVDESGTGNLTAIADDKGNLVERVLYGDAYGDAPRYMRGAAVEHVTFEGTKDPATGTITNVVVKLRLSDDFAPASVSGGVRLAAVNSSNTVVATTAVTPQLSSDNELTWTLNGSEWNTLSGATDAVSLEVAVTNTLQTADWGTAPIAPPPDWALPPFSSGVATTSATPFAVRSSFTSLQTYIDSSPTSPRVLYDIPDLYLAGSTESKVKLLTGFKAAPFVDPATGLAYFRARWYDPATGAWLTPDPVGYRDSSTLYAFCAGDPVNCSDPMGLYDPAAVGHAIFRGKEWLKNKVSEGSLNTPRTGIGPIDAVNNAVDVAGETTVNSVLDFGGDLAAGLFTIGEGTGNAIANYDPAHPYRSSAAIAGHSTLDVLAVIGYGTGIAGLAESGLNAVSEALIPSSMFDISLTAADETEILGSLEPRITQSMVARQRVMANLAEIRAGRNASRFGKYADNEAIWRARNAQLYPGYGGQDPFDMVDLSAGDIVYGGVPGQGAWYTDLESIKLSQFDTEVFNRAIQVAQSAKYPDREFVMAYRVLKNIRVPAGLTLENPQNGFGGAFQYYIENYGQVLQPIRKFRLFGGLFRVR